MKRTVRVSTLATGLFLAFGAGCPGAGPDNADRPNVLVIGDSISIGYFPVVKAALGSARVEHFLEPDGTPLNARSTVVLARHLNDWLAACEQRTGLARWNVVYFNAGLHDLKFVRGFKETTRASGGYQAVSPRRYEENLGRIVERLRAVANTVIFATTTPGVADSPMEPGQVERYNAVARRAMDGLGVAVHDLYAVALPDLGEIRPERDVHFTRKGYARLGKAVAARIAEALGLAAGGGRESSG